MNYFHRILLIIMLTSSYVFLPGSNTLAATLTVTNINDSGAGSLRDAITQANGNGVADTINFNIPANQCDAVTGVCTIKPNSPLPAIIDDETTINGYSQPGAAPATDDASALIKIELDGSSSGAAADGLKITSSDNLIKGLAIYDFPSEGILLNTTDATYNHIEGNFLGLDAAGNAKGNSWTGIYIANASDNEIGGADASQRNIISGNGTSGIEIAGDSSDYNTIENNYIGTTPDGMVARGNAEQGVLIRTGAENNLVYHNLISANLNGVFLWSLGSGDITKDNIIRLNAIGVTPDLSALGNSGDGIIISGYAQNNEISRNLIAYNGDDGVHFDDSTAFDNVILFGSIFLNDGEGIDLSDGANKDIAPPVINQVNPEDFTVSGTACASCLVQVYASRRNDGEGETYIGLANSDAAGNFVVTINSLPGPYLTATATNDLDNAGTSEFSEVFIWSLTYIPLVVR